MQTITAANVIQLINDQIEDTNTTEQIIATLQKYNYSPLTIKHQKILKEQVNPTCRINKQYGMTHIEWVDQDTHWRQQMLIAHQEKHVLINTEWIVENNPSYFGARQERNAKRQAVLDPSNFNAINTLVEAINNYNQAQERLTQILEYNGATVDFSPDKHTIKEQFVDSSR